MTTAAPPPEAAVRIRAKPAAPKRLSRKVLLGGAIGLGAVVAFALLSGLSAAPKSAAAAPEDAPAAASLAMPEALATLPSRYSEGDLSGPALEPPRDMLWGDEGPPDSDDCIEPGPQALRCNRDWQNPAELEPPQDPVWSAAPPPQQPPTQPPAQTRSDQASEAAPPIFFEARRRGVGPVAQLVAQRGEVGQPIEGGGRREGFLAGQQASAEVLDSPYLPPRSPFELHAGAVIPAALVTALNSDLPGRVIAQVTAPVYDSVSGKHLLIPQGARLIGTYDSATSYGDNRVFLVWNRLIMPNGWSIQLGAMEATDPAGAAGLKDKVDNHLGRLAGAIGVSAVLSVLANEAQNDNELGFRQSVGDAAAQEAARVGGRIIDRQLEVRPTLRVRPGAPVRVLVTRDILGRLAGDPQANRRGLRVDP